MCLPPSYVIRNSVYIGAVVFAFPFPRLLQPNGVWPRPNLPAPLRSIPWGEQPSTQKRTFSNVSPFISATFTDHISSLLDWRTP